MAETSSPSRGPGPGRGASFNPANRFEQLHPAPPPQELVEYFTVDEEPRRQPTVFYRDVTRSVLSRNDSPDIGFSYSINPYRGCEHGCIYCYARPSHEYLGFSSGLDFETRIVVKHDAPELLAEEFERVSWKPQVVAMSGNTDCYQPVERSLGLTRRCLEVFLRFRNPVGIITKNALIQRDIDLLTQLAALNLVSVGLSITTLRQDLARVLEPRTAAIARRLETVERLAVAGIPVGVNVAPIIPGLNDEEIPAIVRAAADRGAQWASHTILRLPYAVKDLFTEWMRRNMPDRSAKVLARIRDVRGGRLTSSEFGARMSGEGEYAGAIGRLFRIACEHQGLSRSRNELSCAHFVRTPPRQASLFEE